MNYDHRFPSRLHSQYSVFSQYTPTVLKDFLKCPRYWKLKYLEGREIPADPILNLGIIFHKFAAKVSRRVLVGNIRRSSLAWEIEKCALEIFGKAIKEGLLRHEEQADFLKRCLNTMPMFMRLAKNLWQRVEVEYSAAIDHRYTPADWRRSYLRGRIDLVLFSGDRALIVDWKIGKSPLRLSYADKLSLYIYTLLIFRNFREVSEISAEFFFAGDGEGLRIFITRSDEGMLRRKVENVIKKIESEKDFAPRTGKHCSWCAFNSECEKIF